MLHHPSSLLRQFQTTLDVYLLNKENHIRTDADVERITGYECSTSVLQIHGNRVIIVREPMERTSPADGLLTDQKQLLLMIRAADCQPILAYNPDRNIIGLLHVGWKGLVAKTIPAFFQKLNTEYGVHPADTFIYIGPSIRQCCAQYRETDHPLREFDETFWNGNFVDLAGIADKQFHDAGVLSERIERHRDCTCCHPKNYWTYRGGDKEKVQEGWTNVLAAALKTHN
ncbi:hypothetical protein A3D11_01840 [Candidatus Peribacteria bacterium RIFCSPHIGHO2_02_FULL_49_16]|nr:MAG: hypothetical protein A2880_00950 [Candidatus Peribacteria bacterium RIFCSPHIGHO2_01_FULL_49_38]OGJ58658.1 MAG: hypothetical protein A3D11_01840 [Candidatus Peribacteria bacterium RIFCSPHIGHO2_02_FULL_49_16]